MGVNKKQKIKHKGKSKISFDEEIVTKDYAQKLVTGTVTPYNKISEDIELNGDQKNVSIDPSVKSHIKQKNRNRNKQLTDEIQRGENMEVDTVTSKKRKRKNSEENPTEGAELHKDNIEESEVHSETVKGKKKESNRSLKRKKHAKLIEDKKIKLELELQQKALNYLSKWKHSRSEWKFEKLRQVWLQQNLFDASKIPNEFWDTAVQYFSGAKGHSRQVVLDDATKLIEQEEQSLEENVDEDFKTKLKRARDIVQYLD